MCKKCGNLRPDEIVIIFSLNGRTPELIGLSNYNVIGFKHEHDAIREYEVASRVALHMIARIIIDYLVEEQTE